jgi:hypothetical protein
LTFHPNPARDLLHVQMPDSDQRAELHILDAHGALVMQKLIIGSSDPIQIGGLAPGMYTVRWVTRTGVRVGRFVKQ